jgi:sugar-specific transcriptional regulator TrmB
MERNFLKNIGLSDKEVDVYLTLLKVDNSSVIDLSKNTKILRTSVYPILDALKEKGLVSEVLVGKKVFFQAEPPERIEFYIESQKIRLEEQGALAKEFIPRLKGLSREKGERPIVKIYVGREGIFKANEETYGNIQKNDDDSNNVYFVYPYDLVENMVSSSELKKARSQRTSKNIKSKAIYTYSKGEREETEGSERVKIDGDKYPISCDISVFNDIVRVHTLGKSLSSMVIKSKDFADTMKSLLKIIFENQKNLK